MQIFAHRGAAIRNVWVFLIYARATGFTSATGPTSLGPLVGGETLVQRSINWLNLRRWRVDEPSAVQETSLMRYGSQVGQTEVTFFFFSGTVSCKRSFVGIWNVNWRAFSIAGKPFAVSRSCRLWPGSFWNDDTYYYTCRKFLHLRWFPVTDRGKVFKFRTVTLKNIWRTENRNRWRSTSLEFLSSFEKFWLWRDIP